MKNKQWKVVVGIAVAFTVCHATAETNISENVAAVETNVAESTTMGDTNAVEAVAVETTNTASEVTSVPVEEMEPAPKKRDKFDFIIGGGLVSSSGYGDYIDDVYKANGYSNLDDVSGWLDLYIGVEYRPASQFGIIVGGDIWINGGVDASGGGGLDETYANVIFIPSIYGQLYLTKSRWLYVNAGVNFPIPETGSDFFEFESDGVGFGANIGVEIAGVVRLEGGYVSVPVTVKATASNPLLAGEEDYDFGGAQIRVLLAF
jgi:hypothetical protein